MLVLSPVLTNILSGQGARICTVTMFDTEKFILEVEKRPSTWDSRHESYSNKIIKSNDWSEISEEMIPNWSSLTKEQKQLKGKELTTKWKNIKDKFRKCLNENNSSKSGDPAKKKQKYVYFDILQFLLPVMKERPISGNITGDENLTPTTVDSVENNTSDSDHYHRIRQRPTRTSNIQNVDTALQSDSSTKLLELLKERNDRGLEDMRDEDTLFLLSLVQSLKKLSPLMKMRTKIEIMTAIENNSYVDRSNYTNSSPSYGYNTSSTNVVVPSTSRQVHSALSTVITVPSKESRGQTIITGTSSAQPLFEEVPPTTAETQPSTVFQCNDWANQLCSSEKIASPSDSQISFS